MKTKTLFLGLMLLTFVACSEDRSKESSSEIPVSMKLKFQKAGLDGICKAADEGVEEATATLEAFGVSENKGDLEKDRISNYLKAAEQGDASAQSELSVFYFEGRGVKKDARQGIYWLLKAAEQDYEYTHFIAARYYYLYVDKEDERYNESKKTFHQTLDVIEKAANQGNAYAQYLLLYYYVNIEDNFTKARHWCRKAFENGSEQAKKEFKNHPIATGL